MSKIYQSVQNFLKAFPTQPLIIAYSGGVDSQVLLQVIHQLKVNAAITNDVSVCHVNHGLSPNAHEWHNFAEQQCLQVALPFIPLSVSLDLTQGKSVEALARDARYQALINVSSSPVVILTGHHLDDQAETFLLAMKRGAGVKGLSSMNEISTLEQHVLGRPLIGISRQDIVSFANKNNLDWIEDESNQDNKYDRNFLRNEIIPQLVERWPSIASTISRSAQHCQQSQTLLDELAEIDYQACVDEKDHTALNIPSLLQLSGARFNNLFRYFLTTLERPMPSAAQLNQIRLQMEADVQQTPLVIWGENACRRFQEKLFITPVYNDISAQALSINIEHLVFTSLDTDLDINLDKTEKTELTETIELPDGLGTLYFSVIDTEVEQQNLLVERFPLADNVNIEVISEQTITLKRDTSKIKVLFKHNNPKVLPDFRQHHRPLKKVLQELNIPVWQRKRLPLLFIDDELAVVAGQFICQPFLPSENNLNLTIVWLKYN